MRTHLSIHYILVWCAPVLAELRIWPAVFTGNRNVVCLPAGFERGRCHCSWGEAGHRPGKIVTNQAILQDCPYSKVILFLSWNEDGILRYIQCVDSSAYLLKSWTAQIAKGWLLFPIFASCWPGGEFLQRSNSLPIDGRLLGEREADCRKPWRGNVIMWRSAEWD